MSFSLGETENEQNDIRSLQQQLESTNTLVQTLSKQLNDLREQVGYTLKYPPISDFDPLLFWYGIEYFLFKISYFLFWPLFETC